jgi:hypothetical protein
VACCSLWFVLLIMVDMQHSCCHCVLKEGKIYELLDEEKRQHKRRFSSPCCTLMCSS